MQMNKILPYETIGFDFQKKYGISTVDKLNGVNLVKKLTDKEAKNLIDSMKVLSKFEYFLHKLKEVDLNFSDFMNFLSTKDDGNTERGRKDSFINLNRLFLNFLNSWRIFIEFMESSFKRYFGDKSVEYKDYKSFTGNLFDGNFSYRFFINLRNYSEHEGYPIYTIKIDENGKKEAFFDKRILFSNYFNKKHFATDIRLYNDYFPVLNQCLEAQKHLQKIFDYFMKTYSDAFVACANNVISILGMYDGVTEFCLTEINQSSINQSRLQVIKNSIIGEILK